MARLEDPEILARYRAALANWRYTGYVEWKDVAQDWIRRELSDMPLRAIAEQLYNHVAGGGEIDQVHERRPERNDRDFHYDLRLEIGGRALYVETLLLDDDPNDPTIYVVSVHDA
jgi:hypothetical protein